MQNPDARSGAVHGQKNIENQAVGRPLGFISGFVIVLGAGLTLLGAAVLISRIFELAMTEHFLPGPSGMRANTALNFLLLGSALALSGWGERTAVRVSHALALMAASVGFLTLVEYVSGADLLIDRLLIDEADRVTPARMYWMVAAAFLLLGIAMPLARAQSRLAKVAFVVLPMIAVFVPLLSVVVYFYAYGDVEFSFLARLTISMPAVVGLITLSAGICALRPDAGWFAVVLSRGPGGRVARLLLPGALLVPVVIGWLILQGELLGLYGVKLGMAFYVLSSMVTLAGLTWWVVWLVNRDDEVRQRQAELNRSILESAFDAFVLMDAQGRVVEWNSQAEKIFGWQRSEAIGQKVSELITPPSLQAAHALLLATGESPAIGRLSERILMRRDGTEFPVELIITPLHLDNTVAFSAFVRDVSDQKRIQAQLRQSQKMEAVGQLTGGIAHDFNNLLTVVIGSLDVAVRKVEGEARELIEHALIAADRGAALVQHLLVVSRRQTLMPTSVDFNRIASEMNELLQRTLGEQVKIDVVLDEKLWPAYADQGQVQSAVLNLAINARDAMPDGGRLTIETGNAVLDRYYAVLNPDVTPGDYVMLALTDTGTGMTSEVLAHALEPFYTTKDVGKGSGLGLSMVYGFAQQSKGHLKFYSEVGRGTTVRLYLPRLEAGSVQAGGGGDGVGNQVETTGHETILVVEDDAGVREHVVSQLCDLGYEVVQAVNGVEAQRLLEAGGKADLLFTDIVMPGGMTGHELCDRAKKIRPGLKVLLTSGYAGGAMGSGEGRHDELHFLAKPYRRADLARKVREALGTPGAPVRQPGRSN